MYGVLYVILFRSNVDLVLKYPHPFCTKNVQLKRRLATMQTTPFICKNLTRGYIFTKLKHTRLNHKLAELK